MDVRMEKANLVVLKPTTIIKEYFSSEFVN